MSRLRVLVADDHHAMLDHLVRLLSHDFDVVATVRDGAAAVREAPRVNPDILVLDIAMPILSGLEAAGRLKASGSTAKVVFVTMQQDREFVDGATALGMSGSWSRTGSCRISFRRFAASWPASHPSRRRFARERHLRSVSAGTCQYYQQQTDRPARRMKLRRMIMDRDEAQRWKRIITQDLRLARYSLAMRSGPKEYLRARIAENEAILYSLAATESVRPRIDVQVDAEGDVSVAPHAA